MPVHIRQAMPACLVRLVWRSRSLFFKGC